MKNDLRSHHALELAEIISVEMNLTNQTVQIDKSWSQIICKSSSNTISTKEWKSNIHSKDLEKLNAQLAEFLKNEAAEQFENTHRIRSQNGEWLSYLCRFKKISFDESKRPIVLLMTYQNVTSYIQNEKINKKIQKLARIGGWTYNKLTTKIEATDVFFEVLDLDSCKEVCMSTFLNVFNRDSKFLIKKLFTAALNGLTESATLEATIADNRKWFLIHATPLKNSDQNITSVVGTIQDITDFIRLQKRLEEAQHVAKIGNWSFNLISGKIEWSQEMYSLFPENPILGPPNYERHRSTIHPEDVGIWEETVKNCIETGKSYSMRFRSVFPDKIIWIEALGYVNRNSQNDIVELAGTCQDITEKVNYEIELNQQRVVNMLNSKLISLGEMSAGVAHEINNPLTVIKGNLSLIYPLIEQNERLKKYHSKIETSINRIIKIVNSLRRFSRIDDKKIFNHIDLSNLVNDSLSIIEAKAKRFDVKIDTQLIQNAFIDCDHVEIEQVIVNLLNNAIDAVSLNSGMNEKWIQIKTFENNESIVLQIIDSGMGIPLEIEQKIFLPFFTTKEVGQGTGLGLSICAGIIKNHNATLKLNKSMPYTCFEVTFKKILEPADVA